MLFYRIFSCLIALLLQDHVSFARNNGVAAFSFKDFDVQETDRDNMYVLMTEEELIGASYKEILRDRIFVRRFTVNFWELCITSFTDQQGTFRAYIK